MIIARSSKYQEIFITRVLELIMAKTVAICLTCFMGLYFEKD